MADPTVLDVEIVTPARIAWEGQANEVQAPGQLGEFGVLPGHAAMLTVTRPGVVTLHGADGARRLVVGGGFAEVGPDRVTMLVDLCEEAGEVDKDAAQQMLESASKVLAGAEAGSEERENAERDAKLAQARLDA